MFIALFSLGATVLYAINKVLEDDLYTRVERLHEHVLDRIQVFDSLLRVEELELDSKLQSALPEAYKELKALPGGLPGASSETLKALTDKYGLDEFYVIDKNTVIVATTFKPDQGFELGTISSELRSFLLGLINSGTIKVDRINVSAKTGIWNKYAYYGPEQEEHLLEASVQIREHLVRTRSEEFDHFLFEQYFADLAHNRALIQQVRIFLMNDLNIFSFAGEKPKIQPEEITLLNQAGQFRKVHDGIINIFSKVDLKNSRMAGAESLVVNTEIDMSAIKQLNSRIFIIVLVLTVLFLLAAYTTLTGLLEKNVIRRIHLINEGLERVADGDYSTEMVVDGIDELIDIAKHTNSMRIRIGDRESQLDEARNTLEIRVKERTSELQQEIETRKEAEEKLARLATTDSLTGLMNRRAFDDLAKREYVRAKRNSLSLCLLVLDLDKFKHVNDTYGHDAGDKVLVCIAQSLSGQARKSDLIARFGGEEFIMILPDTPLEGGFEFANRIREIVASKEIDIGNQIISVTVSIGITEWDVNKDKLEDAFKKADTYLYQAKEQGRNRVVSGDKRQSS